LRNMRSIAFRFGRGLQRVMVIGSGEVADNITQALRDTGRSGFNIVAVCGTGVYAPKATKFQSLEKALDSLKELDVDTIIHTELFSDETQNRLIFETALTNHIGYSFVPSEVEFYSGNNIVDVLSGYPIISVSQTPLIGW